MNETLDPNRACKIVTTDVEEIVLQYQNVLFQAGILTAVQQEGRKEKGKGRGRE
jgi:hypothetical protein